MLSKRQRLKSITFEFDENGNPTPFALYMSEVVEEDESTGEVWVVSGERLRTSVNPSDIDRLTPLLGDAHASMAKQLNAAQNQAAQLKVERDEFAKQLNDKGKGNN